MKGPILLAIIDDTQGWIDAVKAYLAVTMPILDYDIIMEEFEDTQAFLTRWHQGYRPHAIKCDMRINGDMKGPEKLHDYLKSIGEQRRIFFATAHLSEHDAQVQARTGADVFIKEQIITDQFQVKLISMYH